MTPSRDPEVAFPLAISAAVFGMVGLTVPVLAWIALALAVIASLLDPGSTQVRVFAILGATMGLVGVVVQIIG